MVPVSITRSHQRLQGFSVKVPFKLCEIYSDQRGQGPAFPALVLQIMIIIPTVVDTVFCTVEELGMSAV